MRFFVKNFKKVLLFLKICDIIIKNNKMKDEE